MKSLLTKLFIDNWQRKLVSVILSMIIWMVLNHSMTIAKTIHSIPIKAINLSTEQPIESVNDTSLEPVQNQT